MLKKWIRGFLKSKGYQLIKPEVIHDNGGIPGGRGSIKRSTDLRKKSVQTILS